MTADVVGLYPNILHNTGLKDLKAREHKAVSTEDLGKMVHFVLENSFLV